MTDINKSSNTQRFMRDYLDALTQGTATLVHAIRRTADEALRPPARAHLKTGATG